MRHRLVSLLTFPALAAAPGALTVLLFVAVLRSGPVPAPLFRATLPQEAREADRCTWWCHNHGCPHRPVLGSFLAGDGGLFGWTVDALHTAGDAVSPGARGVGYGAVNLAVFCALWPAGTYALWVIALRQRRAIRALRLAGAQTRTQAHANAHARRDAP
ncbi:MAG: hypothetical protein ACRELB_19760 [Polyangiaceae bacterium]